jgi:hypothetical protein
LHLVKGDQVIQIARLDDRPLRVGRAPTNDLVVADERISGHHAVFWIEAGAVCVEDVGSRNGTTVNGELIRAPKALNHGDRVSLGGQVEVVVEAPDGIEFSPGPNLCVEVVGSDVRTPIQGERFSVGSGTDDDLVIPGAEVAEAVLMLDLQGEVLLGRGVEEQPLAIGDLFEVGGKQLQLARTGGLGRAATAGLESANYPYNLQAVGRGPRAPVVALENRRSGARYEVERDNRAILLFLLARRLREDLDGRVLRLDAGWVADDEVALGVWGRGRNPADSNALNVLVHRVRRDVRDAGFDPWFIEKRRQRLRVRVAEVRLD